MSSGICVRGTVGYTERVAPCAGMGSGMNLPWPILPDLPVSRLLLSYQHGACHTGPQNGLIYVLARIHGYHRGRTRRNLDDAADCVSGDYRTISSRIAGKRSAGEWWYRTCCNTTYRCCCSASCT